jgi:hypothetical protein
MASEAVGACSIHAGTTTLQMQGKPYKIRDLFQIFELAKKLFESHPEAQNGIKSL